MYEWTIVFVHRANSFRRAFDVVAEDYGTAIAYAFTKLAQDGRGRDTSAFDLIEIKRGQAV